MTHTATGRLANPESLGGDIVLGESGLSATFTEVQAVEATGTATAQTPVIKFLMDGVQATASAVTNTPTWTVTVTSVVATATATANVPSSLVAGFSADTATATATANAPSIPSITPPSEGVIFAQFVPGLGSGEVFTGERDR
jgi:hypothetical protein